MRKPIIGISSGDINGIGMEVVLKTLADKRLTAFCTPIIYASTKVVAFHKNALQVENFKFRGVHDTDEAEEDMVGVVNCWSDNVLVTLGTMSEASGQCAIKSLEMAVADLKAGHIDALVTPPIHKKAMNDAGFQFPGHTEYIASQFGNVQQSVMLMCSEDLRVGLVTNHLPLKDVASEIKPDLIVQKLRTLDATLRRDFGIDRPKIAVLGLNPHAGDSGVLGKEEHDVITPALDRAAKLDILAFGPFAADGLFGSGQYKKFDAILAMYHDQGLVPFKALSFGNGVNYTAGLPVVRTSPDHGTAYDIAGQNIADPSSFMHALFMAVDVVRNRRRYDRNHANPLQRTQLASEDANARAEFIPED
jgi:4-hydroxythreonine-4-phosphate dehydrogenase